MRVLTTIAVAKAGFKKAYYIKGDGTHISYRPLAAKVQSDSISDLSSVISKQQGYARKIQAEGTVKSPEQ